MRKNKVLKSFTLLLCLVVSATGIHAQENKYAGVIAECQDFIKKRMESDGLVGVSVALIIGDSVVWKEGFGYENKEKQIPMSSSTVASIGSITNTFTALSILQLQEKGKLDIYKPVTDYLPQFNIKTRKGDDLKKVTLKTVINHTSGIPTNYFKNYDLHSAKYTDVVGYINTTYLASPPGVRSLYSNVAYSILGNVVKEVSHQDYTDYVRQHIFAPLQMTNSGFSFDSLKHKSEIYYPGGKGTGSFEIRDIPSNGIYSNIDDLIKYAKAMIDACNGEPSSVMNAHTAQEMFKVQNADVLLETNKKGLGWFLFKNDSTFAMFHAGNSIYPASMLLVPKKKIAAIILINTRGGAALASDFSFNILERCQLDVADIVPPPLFKNLKTIPVKLTEKQLEKHTGDYAQKYVYLTVSKENGGLYLVRNKVKIQLKPVGENEFIPVEIYRKDSIVEKKDERYFFKDIDKYHVMYFKNDEREYQLGYKMPLAEITPVWKKRVGVYKHFGYQLAGGFDTMVQTEIYISAERVLMMKLTTSTGEFNYPLVIVSDHDVITGGLNPEETGITINFSESEGDVVMSYNGVTFRQQK